MPDFVTISSIAISMNISQRCLTYRTTRFWQYCCRIVYIFLISNMHWFMTEVFIQTNWLFLVIIKEILFPVSCSGRDNGMNIVRIPNKILDSLVASLIPNDHHNWFVCPWLFRLHQITCWDIHLHQIKMINQGYVRRLGICITHSWCIRIAACIRV